jgi:hypothetical protein
MPTIHSTLRDETDEMLNAMSNAISEELVIQPDISTMLKNLEYIAGQKGPTRLAALRVCGIDRVLLNHMSKTWNGWKCLLCDYGSSSNSACGDVKKHVWCRHQRGSSTKSLIEARRAERLGWCGGQGDSI